jgi:hypothetical protein
MIPEPGLICDHKDCGCYIDPCCFNCPLVQCMYELTHHEQQQVGVRVLLDEGWDEEDVCYIARLSPGFVARVKRGFEQPLRARP